jgi:DNA-binding NtrC family response regulator
VGTTFHVYLPAAERSSRTTEKERVRTFRGEGKILLIDDEDMVRKSVGEGLKRMGYEIECAEDGAEGIRLYKKAMEEKHPFHVVIMDLTIPGGMGGKEAVGKFKEIDRNAKIIASSGYCDDPVMSKFEEYGFISVIAKPFRLQALGEILHNVIV